MTESSELLWIQESLAFIKSLYRPKAQGDSQGLIDTIVNQALLQGRATASLLVQANDAKTHHVLSAQPPHVLEPLLDSAWVWTQIADGKLKILMLNELTCVAILPVVQESFHGALILRVSEQLAQNEHYLGLLEIIRQELIEAIRIHQEWTHLDQWQTRSTAVLETIPQAVIFIDNSGKTSWINASGARMLGIEKDVNRPMVIASAMQKLRSAANNADEILATGTELFRTPNKGLYDWKWFYGSPVSRVLNVTSVPVASKTNSGRLWVFDDITALHIAAEDLQKTNERLVLTTKAAEREAQSKGEFLANMSHEIRTPLNGVLGLTQLLAKEPLEERQLAMIRKIQSAGRFLMNILNDILDLSRIESGQLTIDNDPFDLPTLFSQIESVLGESAHAKGITLDVLPVPKVIGLVRGDGLRIEQILTNLVGNAIKFTLKGGVCLSVASVGEQYPDQRLRFEVRDTGIGINEADITKLFLPFSQAEKGITRRFGGSGLGLSICHRLVQLMGGEIGVESVLGQGSVFWFEVPFETLSEPFGDPSDESSNSEMPVSLKGNRFLVVDDSELNRDLLRYTLEGQAATVVTANDGQEAIDIIGRDPQGFDAILMDIRMPVMDGLTATRIIRADLGLTQLPVFALTAGVLAQEMEAAHEAGVNQVLSKPLDLNQLLLAIEAEISNDGAMLNSHPPKATSDPAPIRGDWCPIEGIDLEMVQKNLGERPELFAQQLNAFLVEHRGCEQEIRSLLDSEAREAAARLMHTLYGNAGQIGAIKIMHLARAIEDSILQGQRHLDHPLNELSSLLVSLETAAAPLCESLESSLIPKVDQGAVDPRVVLAEPADSDLPLSGMHVLLVEDSFIIRDMTETMLLDLGAKVSLAENGQAAIDELRHQECRIDLVLLDLHMPVMDGLETTDIIRGALQMNTLPIIALTGSSGAALQLEAMARGVTDLIPKPIESDILLNLIQKYRPGVIT